MGRKLHLLLDSLKKFYYTGFQPLQVSTSLCYQPLSKATPMNEFRSRILLRACNLLVILGILFVGGCQYDYTSPLPGTIDVKLRVISNNIAFDPLNNFVLK